MAARSAKVGIAGFVLTGLLGYTAHGFTIGAPDAACQAMTPGHSHTPQTGSPPALMKVLTSRLKPGETVDIELEGLDSTRFMGFIMQARDANNTELQIGSFVAGDEAKYMTCGRGIHNSLTHRSSNAKEKVSARWRAPSDYEGEVVFVFTCLTDYTTYWVKQTGPKLRVSKREAVEDENIETTTIVEEEEELSVEGEEVHTVEEDGEDRLEQHDHGEHKHDFTDLINNKDKDKVLDYVIEDDIPQALDFPQPSQKAEEPLNLGVAEEEIESVDTYTPIYISSTTTLRTTTTTTEAPAAPLPIIDGVLQHTDPKDEIYEGCDSSKACFGIPANCVAAGKCTAVVAYYPDKLKFHFEMKAKAPGYVSLGLSRDNKMGEDMTTNCMLQENGNVDISTAYNHGKRGNKPAKVSRREDGITERLKMGRKDGWIHCTWTRNRSLVLENEIWDLEKDKYFIMLAVGEVYDNEVQMHDTKTISGEAMGLGQVGLIKAKSRLYIILHGSFMIAAWICAASLGIMIARYYKQTWTSKKLCGLDQWFIWHRTLMLLVWALSIVGLVLIILDVEGITPTLTTNPHGIMGFVTVGLAFLQPFIALLRCNPMHRHRWIFNWVHWFIGNAAQILGILCVFFAVDLEKAQLPRPETDYLLIAFVAFHFIAHLLMSCIGCMSDSKAAKQSHMKYPPRGPYQPYPGVRPYQGHPYPDYEELKRDNPGAGLRKFGLFVYMIVNFAATAALVLMVVLAPTRPILVDIGILSN